MKCQINSYTGYGADGIDCDSPAAENDLRLCDEHRAEIAGSDTALLRKDSAWVEMPELPASNGEWLAHNGFEEFYKAEGASMCLEVWIRQGQSPGYYISVDNWEQCPGVYADTLPDAMEVISMWLPVVSHSAFLDILGRFGEHKTQTEATQYRPDSALEALISLIRKVEVER